MTTAQRRWGKAGVRLTESETAERDARNRARRNQAAIDRVADDAVAKRLWSEGRVIPAVITFALDAHGLYGPEVDEACGAQEPDVDMWEAGERYPTWEQLCKLAELCGSTPRFFMTGHDRLTAAETSMRFHFDLGPQTPPVLFFRQDVVDATMQAHSDPLT